MSDPLPPRNEEAEEALLGSLLIDPDAIVMVRGLINQTDFYREKNGMIYAALMVIVGAGGRIDYVSVVDALERANHLDDVGRDYLARLISCVPTAVHAEHYAKIVKRHAVVRNVIKGCAEITGLAYQSQGGAEEVVANADAIWQKARSGLVVPDIVDGVDGVHRLVEYQEKLDGMRRLGKLYPDSPWDDMNDMLPSLQPGNLVLIGAAAGHGKTSLMECIAEHNAQRGHEVLFFHLELSTEEMMQRQAARYGVNNTLPNLRRGIVDFDELAAVGATVESWTGKVRYVHAPGWGVGRICAYIAREVMLRRCSLVIVDYLHKIAQDERVNGRSDEMALANIVEQIKTTAETTGVPVILAGQVNREYAGRSSGSGRKLQASDFRGTGQALEKSNAALLLWNENVADPNCNHTMVNVYVVKNTFGLLGDFQLRWVKERLKFENAKHPTIVF